MNVKKCIIVREVIWDASVSEFVSVKLSETRKKLKLRTRLQVGKNVWLDNYLSTCVWIFKLTPTPSGHYTFSFFHLNGNHYLFPDCLSLINLGTSAQKSTSLIFPMNILLRFHSIIPFLKKFGILNLNNETLISY